jgi:nucleotide-binding universal stress UspA family protein
MFERILIPMDGSELAEATLPVVEELIAKLLPAQKVEVTLIQVVSALTHWVVAGDKGAPVAYTKKELAAIEKEASNYLEKAGEGLRKKGATVKTIVSIGSAADEIMKATIEAKADLIAMSTHGRSGLGRWAFGSVADKVLRGETVPVLLVRIPRKPSKT